MVDADVPGANVILDGVAFRAADAGNPAQRRGGAPAVTGPVPGFVGD